METYKIRKGLDLRLAGEAEKSLATLPVEGEYAVMPGDFPGIVPRVLVKEGTRVKAGDPLFTDKATEKVMFVSPVSGTVTAIDRGERRKVLAVRVKADGTGEAKSFGTLDADAMSGDDVRGLLLESGLFAFVRQRPYDVVPAPDSTPKAVFVSAFSKMPLAADFTYVAEGREADFKAGLAALAKIAPVHLGICPAQSGSSFVPSEGVEVAVFDGPNPSGNVGVHINHISPVNKGETVWTVGAEAVIFIGSLLRTGHIDLTRRVAVAGAEVDKPHYCETPVGTALSRVIGGSLKHTEHVRVRNGNPLVGAKTSADGFLAAYATEVCAIPEGDDVNEAFGWIAPRLNDFSTSHSYLSWLFGKGRKYNLDCRIKGGERHMIMSGEYDRVFPMDIYAGYLVKAIITGDIDRQEALGIYEVAPEDFAVAEFVDSSKLELQRIVREGLDLLRKENA